MQRFGRAGVYMDFPDAWKVREVEFNRKPHLVVSVPDTWVVKAIDKRPFDELIARSLGRQVGMGRRAVEYVVEIK